MTLFQLVSKMSLVGLTALLGAHRRNGPLCYLRCPHRVLCLPIKGIECGCCGILIALFLDCSYSVINYHNATKVSVSSAGDRHGGFLVLKSSMQH